MSENGGATVEVGQGSLTETGSRCETKHTGGSSTLYFIFLSKKDMHQEKFGERENWLLTSEPGRRLPGQCLWRGGSRGAGVNPHSRSPVPTAPEIKWDHREGGIRQSEHIYHISTFKKIWAGVNEIAENKIRFLPPSDLQKSKIVLACLQPKDA